MSPINVYAAVPSQERWEAPGRVPVPWVTVEPPPDPDPDPPPPVFGTYRDRTNTGLQVAGVLGQVSTFPVTTGNTFVTSNTTITRRRFSSSNLVITGNNLIFRECKFDGTVTLNTTSDVKFYDCDLGSIIVQSSKRILVDRCYWTGMPSRDGIKFESYYAQAEDLTVQNSYVGNPIVLADDHYDGIQTGGFKRFKVLGCTLDSGHGGLYLAHHVVFFTQRRSDMPSGLGMVNDDFLVEGCHIRSRGVYTFNIHGTNEVYRNNTFYPSSNYRSAMFHTASTAVITSDNNRWFDGALAFPNGTVAT